MATHLIAALPCPITPSAPTTAGNEWRTDLPVLQGNGFTLVSYASLTRPRCSRLTTEEVTRFYRLHRKTVEGFERFIT